MIDVQAPLNERFEHLLALISSEHFLKMQGLGNEVPFFICPYDPRETVDMQKMEKQLARKLGSRGIQVLEINLYDLCLELLRARDIWDRLLTIEEDVEKAQLLELLQGTLDTEQHLVPAIAEKMQAAPFDVLFLTGVGEVFPYIRSHTVLNNLQSTAKDAPLVLFFPGEYTHTQDAGAKLNLFGRLQDDKYYRAFNIYNREV